MAQVTVRPAATSDGAELFALTSAFPTPTPSSIDVFRSLLPAKLADPRSAILVAEESDHLVGYVSGMARLAFYAGGATAWVDEIFVLPTHRGTGIGRGLMVAFEAWAHQQQCVSVALATRAAGPFYERLGYESRASYFKKYLGRDIGVGVESDPSENDSTTSR